MSQNKLAQLTGLSQSNLSRKMKALRPFDLDELETIASVLGVSVESFFGVATKDPHPDGPNGGQSVVRPKGFEPLTSWLDHEGRVTSNNVVPLWPAVEPEPNRRAA